jgi:hypothetical protein
VLSFQVGSARRCGGVLVFLIDQKMIRKVILLKTLLNKVKWTDYFDEIPVECKKSTKGAHPIEWLPEPN